MNKCCAKCKDVLDTGTPHNELILLSEVTGSKIYKCDNCKTYMHCVLDVWEIFMASSAPNYRKVSSSNSIADKSRQNKAS